MYLGCWKIPIMDYCPIQIHSIYLIIHPIEENYIYRSWSINFVSHHLSHFFFYGITIPYSIKKSRYLYILWVQLRMIIPLYIYTIIIHRLSHKIYPIKYIPQRKNHLQILRNYGLFSMKCIAYKPSPRKITIFIGDMVTLPSHGWFIALFYPD
jgi:hypothetical protein